MENIIDILKNPPSFQEWISNATGFFNDFRALAMRTLKSLIPTIKFDGLIPKVSFPSMGELFKASTELVEQATEFPSIMADKARTNSYASGGRVQGQAGRPVPIIAHAGETISRSDQSQQTYGPTEITLMLDGRVLTKVITDNMTRQLKYKSGLLHGAI